MRLSFNSHHHNKNNKLEKCERDDEEKKNAANQIKIDQQHEQKETEINTPNRYVEIVHGE